MGKLRKRRGKIGGKGLGKSLMLNWDMLMKGSEQKMAKS